MQFLCRLSLDEIWLPGLFLDQFPSYIIPYEKKIFSVSLEVCLIKAQAYFGNLELTSLSLLSSVIYLFEILNPVLLTLKIITGQENSPSFVLSIQRFVL